MVNNYQSMVHEAKTNKEWSNMTFTTTVRPLANSGGIILPKSLVGKRLRLKVTIEVLD
jgi:putative transposon-encoded protein